MFRNDNFTPTQWLQKFINHKTGAAWADEQTITHIRNACRVDLIDWFDSLSPLNIDTAVWNTVKTAFKIDFRAAPSEISVGKKYLTLHKWKMKH